MTKIIINRDEIDNWCYENGIPNPLDTSIINYTDVIQEKEVLKAMPKNKNEYLELILPLIHYGTEKNWITGSHEIIADNNNEILDDWLTIVIDLTEDYPDPYTEETVNKN